MLESLEEDYPKYVVSFSDFDVGRVIGHGGYSEVYFGLQKSTGIYVAIKILKQKELTEESFLIYEREIKILANAKNRFILGFIGFTTVYPYAIITVYTSGNSLYNALHHVGDAPVLTGTQKSKIAFAIAIGMKRLHHMRVIHRDLKSLNILLDRQLYPKICDFGLSRFVTNAQTLLTVNIGTPHWMAPDLFEGSMYTNKVDVYSYAMVLWELLVGSYPFKGVPPVQIAYLVCKKQERPKLPSRTPNSLAKLITKCWTHKPEERPSFGRIYKEFMEEQVHFPDTDMNELNRFMKECVDNMDVPYEDLEMVKQHPRRYSIPPDFKSVHPFEPSKFEIEDVDLASLPSCKSNDFIKALNSVKKDLQPFRTLEFFKTLCKNIEENPSDDVLYEIVKSAKDLIWESPIALSSFVESNLFYVLPLNRNVLIDLILDIYLQVFASYPSAINKSHVDHIFSLAPACPHKILCIIHRYLCGHSRNQFFSDISDYLLSSYQLFLNADSSKEYLRLLFTVVSLNEDFKYARFPYLQSILFEAIRLQIHPQLATDIFISSIDPNIQINQDSIVSLIQQDESVEFALSILSRISNIVPTIQMMSAIMEAAKKFEIASLLLCRLCENESVSTKLAETIEDWSYLNLPNIQGTFRLFVMLLHNKRNIRVLSSDESSLELLKRVIVLKNAKLITDVNYIFSYLNSAAFINAATDFELLSVYFRTCLEMGDTTTVAGCIYSAESLARTSWSDDYLQILPLSVALLKQMGGWEKYVLPFLSTLSYHEEALDEIIDAEIEETLNILLASPELGAYAQVILNNIQ